MDVTSICKRGVDLRPSRTTEGNEGDSTVNLGVVFPWGAVYRRLIFLPQVIHVPAAVKNAFTAMAARSRKLFRGKINGAARNRDLPTLYREVNRLGEHLSKCAIEIGPGSSASP